MFFRFAWQERSYDVMQDKSSCANDLDGRKWVLMSDRMRNERIEWRITIEWANFLPMQMACRTLELMSWRIHWLSSSLDNSLEADRCKADASCNLLDAIECVRFDARLELVLCTALDHCSQSLTNNVSVYGRTGKTIMWIVSFVILDTFFSLKGN